MNIINTMIDVAQFNLTKQILKSASSAKLNLGLDWHDEYEQCKALVYEGKTYIASIKIVGWQLMAMYDHMPIDFASFQQDVSSTVSVNPTSMQGARTFITTQFLLDTWYETKGFAHPIDDEYFPERGMSGIELLDNFGNVVAYANVNIAGEIQWDDSNAMSESEIAEANIQIKEIYSEASMEAGWDNFETARNLRNHAQAISRKIAIALNAKRLVSIN